MCECPRYENGNEHWVAHTVSCRVEQAAANQQARMSDAQRTRDRQVVAQMMSELTPADVARLMKKKGDW